MKSQVLPLLVGAAVTLLAWHNLADLFMKWGSFPHADPVGASAVASPFVYAFEEQNTVPESESEQMSSNPYWWVNSGGSLEIRDGIGKTIQGEARRESFWRWAYAQKNPSNTDYGAHPQNIFRLLTRSTWKNAEQEIYIRVTRFHISPDVNRNASNGILLFSRYQDADTLYYAGIRVDGYAIIKKKDRGAYYTLAYMPLYASESLYTYNREVNPHLIPGDTWIGLRMSVQNEEAHRVCIRLWVDTNRTGEWKLAAEAVDDGMRYGGPAFTQAGYAGVRTDFMDVEFDDYRITSSDKDE